MDLGSTGDGSEWEGRFSTIAGDTGGRRENQTQSTGV
jgi:hypothetical protein